MSRSQKLIHIIRLAGCRILSEFQFSINCAQTSREEKLSRKLSNCFFLYKKDFSALPVASPRKIRNFVHVSPMLLETVLFKKYKKWEQRDSLKTSKNYQHKTGLERLNYLYPSRGWRRVRFISTQLITL